MCWASSVAAQPVPLALQPGKGQMSISWRTGLSLVQPQRTTNLAAGAWLDFGAATAGTNVVDTNGLARAFYRLRFLAPNIITQPQGQSLPVGGSIALNANAAGTAPLAFQWRRNGTNLSGQTSASLGLTNVVTGSAGDYSVVIANSAGAVTSVVAVVTVVAVTNPLTPPRGVYMGKFAGQTNNAGFAFMIRTNGTAVTLEDSSPQGGTITVTNLLIAPNGSFSASTPQGGALTGVFATNGVSGTLASTNGFKGSFSGAQKSDTGLHQADAGYYEGTFGGLLTGSVSSIFAADGTTFTFLAGALANGGAFGMIDAANNFSGIATFTLPGTTTPAMIQITGSLNSVTHVFMGTYSLSGFALGTFSLTRVATP